MTRRGKRRAESNHPDLIERSLPTTLQDCILSIGPDARLDFGSAAGGVKQSVPIGGGNWRHFKIKTSRFGCARKSAATRKRPPPPRCPATVGASACGNNWLCPCKLIHSAG